MKNPKERRVRFKRGKCIVLLGAEYRTVSSPTKPAAQLSVLLFMSYDVFLELFFRFYAFLALSIIIIKVTNFRKQIIYTRGDRKNLPSEM